VIQRIYHWFGFIPINTRAGKQLAIVAIKLLDCSFRTGNVNATISANGWSARQIAAWIPTSFPRADYHCPINWPDRAYDSRKAMVQEVHNSIVP
jgi:hypothetical protein